MKSDSGKKFCGFGQRADCTAPGAPDGRAFRCPGAGWTEGLSAVRQWWPRPLTTWLLCVGSLSIYACGESVEHAALRLSGVDLDPYGSTYGSLKGQFGEPSLDDCVVGYTTETVMVSEDCHLAQYALHAGHALVMAEFQWHGDNIPDYEKPETLALNSAFKGSVCGKPFDFEPESEVCGRRFSGGWFKRDAPEYGSGFRKPGERKWAGSVPEPPPMMDLTHSKNPFPKPRQSH